VQVKPESLKAIALRLGKCRFRVRNVISMYDYLTMDAEYDGFITMVNLDNKVYSQINTEQNRYVLLSSSEEVEYLNGKNLTTQSAIEFAGANYWHI